MLSRLAIPWIAAIALEANPVEMGLLLVANVAAGAVGSLLLGAAVDRRGKRAVMVAADVASACTIGALAALAFAGKLAFWMLVVAAAGTGLLGILFDLARSAWIAQRVPTPDLPARNAQLSAGGSIAETAAFAIGGWLYQGLGAVVALVVDAVSYVVSALFLRGVPEAPPAPREPSSPRPAWKEWSDDVREGIAAVFAVRELRALATIDVLISLGSSLAGTSYMIFVTRELGFETGILGMIFAAGGIGSVFGAVLAPALGALLGPGRAMAFGLAFFTLGAFFIPLAPGATILGAVLLVAHQIVGDGGHTIFNVHDRTLRQTAVTPALLARVDGGIRTLGQVATLVGAVAGGALALSIGVRNALTLSAAIFALATVEAWWRLARARGGR
jgi:MFS family permease